MQSLSNMWQYFVLIAGAMCALPLPTSGFWWPKTTTETPRSGGQVLQQIPLTYFRTYTYQPLAGGAFGVPLFGFGAAQTPLLSGRHYDPYAVTSYAAARRHDVAAGGFKPDVTPPALLSGGSVPSASTTTSTAAPTTTTTTTTTTTPAPTTTSTTTTTTSSTTSAPPPQSSTVETTSSLRYAAYNAEYPTYSRRVNNLYNARPQYPYPDYFNYQPQGALSEKSGSRIQFVPCMCPVSVPSMSSSTDRDRPTGVSISTAPVGAGDILSLQARHIESEEADVEEDEEDGDADIDADASPDADGGDVVAATKIVAEPQLTTPAVEFNSVV